MKINEMFTKNTVEAENQTREKFKIHEVVNPQKRVLFLGNSITLHETAAHIGWNFNWGMSASSEEKDYVHIVLKGLREKYGEISHCVVNVGEWEKNYFQDGKIEKFKGAREFAADTVIFRLGETVHRDAFDEDPLTEYMRAGMEYFTGSAKKVVVTDTFWEHSYICGVLRELAKEKGYEFVSICDLGEQDENKALGLFKHEGVAGHPGDLGMKRIAERILEKL